MIVDQAYKQNPPGELVHQYGKNIHILNDPYLNKLLAKIGHPQVAQPLFTMYFESIYQYFFSKVFAHILNRTEQVVTTRMNEQFSANLIEETTALIFAGVARAGTWPNQIGFHQANLLVNPALNRQDHFYMSRRLDEKGQVVGVDFSGSKIGGSIADSIVFIPDPMAATGGSMCAVLDHYKNAGLGRPKKWVSLHLIVTPEYIKRLQKEHPDLEIFAIRLDRGFSSKKALADVPGKFPDEESGLNQHQYIVPGAGGLGELLNNTEK